MTLLNFPYFRPRDLFECITQIPKRCLEGEIKNTHKPRSKSNEKSNSPHTKRTRVAHNKLRIPN